MGAWSHGTFDNDDALDWVDQLLGGHAPEVIQEALRAVPVSDNEYLVAPVASAALAAAEVVAAQAGYPTATLPDEVSVWVASQPPPKSEWIVLARRVVERILRASELRDLWLESGELEKWQAEIARLLDRLRQSPT